MSCEASNVSVQLFLNVNSPHDAICQSFHEPAKSIDAKIKSFKKADPDVAYDPTMGICYLWTLKTPGQVVCMDIETAGTAFVTAYVQPCALEERQKFQSTSTGGRHVSGNEMIDKSWWGPSEIQWRGAYDEIGGLTNWADWLTFQLTHPFKENDLIRWQIYQPKTQLILPDVKKSNSQNKWPIRYKRLMPINSQVVQSPTHAICLHLQPFVDSPDGVCLRRVVLYGREIKTLAAK